MGSITIHALDADLDQRLSDEARRRKRSKNALVKELLSRSLGLPAEGEDEDEYGEFLGLWIAEESAGFATIIADNEGTDPSDWL